jgi:hypothetical protein
VAAFRVMQAAASFGAGTVAHQVGREHAGLFRNRSA